MKHSDVLGIAAGLAADLFSAGFGCMCIREAWHTKSHFADPTSLLEEFFSQMLCIPLGCGHLAEGTHSVL